MTDKYILRLRPHAIKRLLEELRSSFNSKVEYKSKNYSWDIILKLKTQEIAKYILGRDNELDFIDPSPELHMEDSKKMRGKILSLTPTHARRIGINKSTLWNLQNRTRSKRPLKIYRKIAEKISGCN